MILFASVSRSLAPVAATTYMDSQARFHLISRKIAQIRLNNEDCALPTFKDNNNEIILKKSEIFEDIKPLYCCPSDFIDEFGRFKSSSDDSGLSGASSSTFEMPSHLQTEGLLAIEKIKKYMIKRFPERLLQIRSFSTASEQVFTAWRSRTRRREAEWGDPEDLGKISNDPRPEEAKIAPEIDQLAIDPKFLLPRYFIPNLSSRLYHSNRPTMQPTSPFSRFDANTAVWSPSERKTFIELYLQNPKNFGRISAHLPLKSCEQCVEFYYRHKKEYKLKQMVASYRKAMVAQRKLILNTAGNGGNGTGGGAVVNAAGNMNILPMSQALSNSTNTITTTNNNLMIVDEDSGNNPPPTGSSSRKRTGRPVGRPKSKDKQ